MGRRNAHAIVTPAVPVLPASQQQASDSSAPTVLPSTVDEQGKGLMPAAQSLLGLFDKINRKGFLQRSDLNRIALIVGGNPRRILSRLLIGLYQRSLSERDAEEAQRARLLMNLHESERLEENLEAGV